MWCVKDSSQGKSFNIAYYHCKSQWDSGNVCQNEDSKVNTEWMWEGFWEIKLPLIYWAIIRWKFVRGNSWSRRKSQWLPYNLFCLGGRLDSVNTNIGTKEKDKVSKDVNTDNKNNIYMLHVKQCVSPSKLLNLSQPLIGK